MRGGGRGLAATLAAPFLVLALWFLASLAGALLPGHLTPQPGPQIHEIRLIGTAFTTIWRCLSRPKSAHASPLLKARAYRCKT